MTEMLRVDAQRCIHETLDGDTIVIDAERGWLLVLDAVGSAVWEALVVGATASAIIEDAIRRYGPDAESGVADLIAHLRTAQLLVADASAPTSVVTIDWPATYVVPEVNRFDDVAEILMLDPIHEVAPDSGWPNAAPPQPKES